MKLYYSKGACSLAVRIVINELGLKCEFESVNLKTKQTESGGDFLSISPKGAVPVLAIDKHEVLTENSIIQQYLADTHKAAHLLPPVGDFKRYRVLEWLNFISTDIHKGFGPLFDPSIPQELKDSIFIPNIKKKLKFIEQHLAKNNQFLAGDHFTLPDAYLYVMLVWSRHFKIDIAELPHLTKYFSSLNQRPAIMQSLKEEGF